ncbi:Hypothetical predicted protein [Lecanosticta acicola]|uniref:Uncharacterized protein n=1 Tax=Lecanosticta acicola TaxID=111012 RepID=A0AAI8W147_9PEZI|nr:Hypothetical predicted protein [Lecanosticta acicola]
MAHFSRGLSSSAHAPSDTQDGSSAPLRNQREPRTSVFAQPPHSSNPPGPEHRDVGSGYSGDRHDHQEQPSEQSSAAPRTYSPFSELHVSRRDNGRASETSFTNDGDLSLNAVRNRQKATKITSIEDWQITCQDQQDRIKDLETRIARLQEATGPGRIQDSNAQGQEDGSTNGRPAAVSENASLMHHRKAKMNAQKEAARESLYESPLSTAGKVEELAVELKRYTWGRSGHVPVQIAELKAERCSVRHETLLRLIRDQKRLEYLKGQVETAISDREGLVNDLMDSEE